MYNLFGQFKGKKFEDVLRTIISSHVFPFFTAAVVMLFYYLGWDMASIFYLTIVTIAMLLLLDDLTPLISHFFFFSVFVSIKHSPSEKALAADPGYFMRVENLALIGIMLTLVIAAIIIRFITLIKERTFKPTPVFFGLCALAAAFLLNGLGKAGYSFFDFIYGVVMAAVYLPVFVLISSNVQLCEKNFKKICFGFLALSILLIIELAVLYISKGSDMLDADGEINKEMVVFGWGIWNTIGMLFVICIPPVTMLATKYKYGFAFILLSTLLAVCVFLTTSRQSMIGVAVVYPVSLILALIKNKNRLAVSITISCILLAGITFIAVKWDLIIKLLGSIFDNLLDENGIFFGNGRIKLIKTAMQFFISRPIFGSGFYLNFQENDFTGLAFVPEFACNTFAEILAACGIVGFFAYIVHRVQTFIAFANKPTQNKAFFALILTGILLISLLDNHMFNIFPNLIYSSLLPFALGEVNGIRPYAPVRNLKRYIERRKNY